MRPLVVAMVALPMFLAGCTAGEAVGCVFEKPHLGFLLVNEIPRPLNVTVNFEDEHGKIVRAERLALAEPGPDHDLRQPRLPCGQYTVHIQGDDGWSMRRTSFEVSHPDDPDFGYYFSYNRTRCFWLVTGPAQPTECGPTEIERRVPTEWLDVQVHDPDPQGAVWYEIRDGTSGKLLVHNTSGSFVNTSFGMGCELPRGSMRIDVQTASPWTNNTRAAGALFTMEPGTRILIDSGPENLTIAIL